MLTTSSFMMRHRRWAASLLILFGLLTLSGRSLAQLPRYIVLFPAQITSGPYSGDFDIFGTSFFSDGLLEGNPQQPRAISSQSYKELNPIALPDFEGGYFLAYTVEHSDSAHRGDRDILMRRVDHNGAELWGDTVTHAVVVAQSKYVEQNPKIVPLEDGTLMVFYEVHYGPNEAGVVDVDVAAIRLARDGRPLWESGVLAASSKRQELLSGAIADGKGGAIALLEVRTYRDSLLNNDIMAQRVDSSGSVIGWKDSKEPVVVAASSYLERNPSMVADGNGGAYITYEIEYNKGARAGDVDLLAQHLTSYGSRGWTDESNLPIVSSNAKAKEVNPVMVRDSSGVIIAFEMSFPRERGKGMAHVIGMQRLDSTGRSTWNLGKKSKLISVRNEIPLRPQLISDPTGGAYLLFESRDTATGNHDIYAQRVNSEGDQIWGDGERPLAVFNSPEVEIHPVAITDGMGGIVVVAVRQLTAEDAHGYSAVVAQRVAIDGTLPWATMQSPLVLATSTYSTGRPVIVKE